MFTNTQYIAISDKVTGANKQSFLFSSKTEPTCPYVKSQAYYTHGYSQHLVFAGKGSDLFPLQCNTFGYHFSRNDFWPNFQTWYLTISDHFFQRWTCWYALAFECLRFMNWWSGIFLLQRTIYGHINYAKSYRSCISKTATVHPTFTTLLNCPYVLVLNCCFSFMPHLLEPTPANFLFLSHRFGGYFQRFCQISEPALCGLLTALFFLFKNFERAGFGSLQCFQPPKSYG